MAHPDPAALVIDPVDATGRRPRLRTLHHSLGVQHVARHGGDPDSRARVGCSWRARPVCSAGLLPRRLQARGGRADLPKLQLD